MKQNIVEEILKYSYAKLKIFGNTNVLGLYWMII